VLAYRQSYVAAHQIRPFTQRAESPWHRIAYRADMGDMPSDHLRILLVDDHSVVREGLRALLEAESDLEVVSEAASVEEAVRRAGLDEPDLVVMDVQLPDGSGVDACREIKSRWPGIVVVMLSSFADSDALQRAVAAGASGYLLKRIRSRELVEGVRKAGRGESLIDPSLSVIADVGLDGDDPIIGRLSAQERRVLRLIEQGKTNREIGEDLFLAEKTVKNYVSNMLAKMGMSRRSEAAAYAARLDARTKTPFPAGSWDELRTIDTA